VPLVLIIQVNIRRHYNGSGVVSLELLKTSKWASNSGLNWWVLFYPAFVGNFATARLQTMATTLPFGTSYATRIKASPFWNRAEFQMQAVSHAVVIKMSESRNPTQWFIARRFYIPLRLKIGNLGNVCIVTFFRALTLLVGRQERNPACKKLSGGMLAWLCLGQGAGLHMAQLMPLCVCVCIIVYNCCTAQTSSNYLLS